ncbi:hypothetical protein [Aristaeella hokkaidonensis]|uniref:Uncharacterized protein n=1 Tax=Aristaeella hokkaidonensis TaxID=3046382 RepID=A0AC61N1C1_9FIRM|nr:hypothetical protein [Aristaeella hokkaidonensis]QUC66974.1 hypothetical protein JYE49_14230 [Aristaeella hokkaidonensis]SNT94392.1 hypothetical protein SAMN06297421_10549 [Aristaeella hokkaidonensis]
MEWFSTEAELSAWKNRDKRLTAAFRILIVLTLITFIVLCLLVRTENADTLHLVLMAVTVVMGWICVIVYQLGIKEARTQAGHLDMLLKGEKDFREGRITLTRETIRIPKSIRIRKVLLDTGEEEPARLNLDERWISRMPPDGSRVRLALAHSYIAGAETLEQAPAEKSNGASRRPARLQWGKLLPLLGIWALVAVFFSSFVFYQITDTVPANKLTLYIDGEVQNETRLAVLLEKGLPSPIRMVQVHPFTYAMFGSDALRAADLYIVPDSDLEQFADWFAPGEESVLVHDPESGVSVADTWILYTPEETYRLYLGAASAHLEDGLARQGAELFMNLKTEEETR